MIEQLEAAGFEVVVEAFVPEGTRIAAVETTATGPLTMGRDIYTMSASPTGSAAGVFVPVDVEIPPSNPTSGCEASDFEGFPAGAIAVVQRGNCYFSDKAANAEAAGAAGVLLFNTGTTGNTDVFSGDLSSSPPGIPVVAAAYDVGVTLVEAVEGKTVTGTSRSPRTTAP